MYIGIYKSQFFITPVVGYMQYLSIQNNFKLSTKPGKITKIYNQSYTAFSYYIHSTYVCTYSGYNIWQILDRC